MSITVTQEDIGRTVIYRPSHGAEERGVITGIPNLYLVHVRYGDDTGSKATQVEDLEWPDEYLIWSEEHGRWWNPGHAGYTNQVAHAGRYSKEEADRIVQGANYGSTFNEIAIPFPAGLDALVRRSRDGQS